MTIRRGWSHRLRIFRLLSAGNRIFRHIVLVIEDELTVQSRRGHSIRVNRMVSLRPNSSFRVSTPVANDRQRAAVRRTVLIAVMSMTLAIQPEFAFGGCGAGAKTSCGCRPQSTGCCCAGRSTVVAGSTDAARLARAAVCGCCGGPPAGRPPVEPTFTDRKSSESVPAISSELMAVDRPTVAPASLEKHPALGGNRRQAML